MASLKDKVVVITGASSGIGKALADAALDFGAKVAVCARNEQKLRAAFNNNDQLLYAAVDVSKEADCQKFIGDILQKWGRVDVLINNAGITMRALFEEADLSVIRELMDINFLGNGVLYQVCPHIYTRKQGGDSGVIVHSRVQGAARPYGLFGIQVCNAGFSGSAENGVAAYGCACNVGIAGFHQF